MRNWVVYYREWSKSFWLPFIIGALLLFGCLAILSASQTSARRLGYDNLYFVNRQLLFYGVFILTVRLLYAMDSVYVRRLMFGLFILTFGLLVLTLFYSQTKGASRWIKLGFFNLQPVELIKPLWIIVFAWLLYLSQHKPHQAKQLLFIAFGSLVSIVFVLIQQPDYGQTLLIIAISVGMWFVYTADWRIIVVGFLGAIGLLTVGYITSDHVKTRIDKFLIASELTNTQTDIAFKAIISGGLFGKGIGNGIVKYTLPDAHTDFILSVVFEELGLLTIGVLFLFYAVLIYRIMEKAKEESFVFTKLTYVGFSIQLSTQIIINVASNLNLIPPKGMTLPFMSYGGSSLLGLAIMVGILFNFSKH